MADATAGPSPATAPPGLWQRVRTRLTGLVGPPSTAFGRLVRTTAFKLSLIYLVVFSVAALLLVVWIGWNTQRLLFQGVRDTVDADVSALSDQYRAGGLRRLVVIVERLTERNANGVYLLTSFQGEPLAGNVAELPAEVLSARGWRDISYRRSVAPQEPERRALVRVEVLPGGFRLLVGRDVEEREELRRIFGTGFRWAVVAIVLIALGVGIAVTRRVLRRIDQMSATTRTIMAGDLTGRVPVTGSRDEFDRLAENLNAMLGRIEGLMRGMKEVSDNIAHDLKTPLTRLRARTEEALRTARSEEDYRTALDQTLHESEALIRTFDALLMIARAEAGNARADMGPIDVAEIAASIAELYEPVADDRGARLEVVAKGPHLVVGNRELVGQVLANLIDNALKYGVPQRKDGAPPVIRVVTAAAGGRVTVSVEDEGSGIAPADRERATERFVRLEPSRSQPGSGLGLALAKAVARLHGGSLRLAAAPGGVGLAVTLDLPAAQATGPRP